MRLGDLAQLVARANVGPRYQLVLYALSAGSCNLKKSLPLPAENYPTSKMVVPDILDGVRQTELGASPREEERQRDLHSADRFGRQRMVCTGQPMRFVFGAEPSQIGPEILSRDWADPDVANVV